MKKKKSKNIISGASFICLGIIMILIAIIIDSHSGFHDFPLETLTHILSHFGIGFLVLGALGMLFEATHWTDYFKDRLSEIIIEKKYLEQISEQELVNLQTEVLKAYFKDDQIAGAEGFLNHYQKNIQELIGHPYRENVRAYYAIEYDGASQNTLKVHHELTWTCKSNRGSIQNLVRYVPEKGEFDDLDFCCITFSHNSFSKNDEGRNEVSITYSEFSENGWLLPNGEIVIPLTQYSSFDGLEITIILNFKIPVNRLIAWKMAQISKGVSITVRHPKDLAIFRVAYSMNTMGLSERKEIDYFSWQTQGWLLPNEGISFQFEKNIEPEEEILA